MKDLFGNVAEAPKPEEPFKFTDAERSQVCSKISDFADVVLTLAHKPDIDPHIEDLINDIETIIASDVSQH